MAFGRKTGKRRIAAALVTGGLLGSLLAFNAGTPALANHGPAPVAFPGPAQFSAYASGIAAHVDGLTTGGEPGSTVVADASVITSTAAMNTAGLSQIVTELNTEAVPAQSDKESFGRGSPVEVALGGATPIAEPDIPIAGRADSASHPAQRTVGGEPDEVAPENEFDTGAPPPAEPGFTTTNLATVPASALAYVEAATAQSQAIWNPDMCILGVPVNYGRAFAAKAELLDTGETPESGDHQAPVLAVDSPPDATPANPQRNAADSRSLTYLIDNKDGSWGIGTQTRMTVAPISLLSAPVEGAPPGTEASTLTIELAGVWVFETIANGHEPVQFKIGPDPETADPQTPVLRVLADGELQGQLLFQDLFDAEGLNLPPELEPILDLSIGEDPRAIAAPGAVPVAEAPPVATITEGAAAVDVVRLSVLQPSAPDAGQQVLDVRIGHMESRVTVPDGGIRCPIPVSKTGAESVTEDEEFTWTISIPKSATAMLGFGCDLVNITARDHIAYPEGRNGMTVTFLEASNGGVINGEEVTWANLGSYRPGDPPIVLTLKARISGVPTGGGLVQNIVDVSANLGNCQGTTEVYGFALLGAAKIDGSTNVLGTGVHPGTRVAAAQVLPATGPSSDTPMFAGLAIAALLSAAGVYRLNRKSAPTV